MLLIFTGNGKGKTTSAIGTAIRATGQKKKTAIVFFDKGGDVYGEQHFFNSISQNSDFGSDLDIFRFGYSRFDEDAQTFRFENTPEDTEQAQKATDKLLTLYKEGYFLIVADELINCLNLNLTTEQTVRELIDRCPETTHLILTGRSAPDWLTQKADLVSEITDVKHYYRKTGKPIKGLDY